MSTYTSIEVGSGELSVPTDLTITSEAESEDVGAPYIGTHAKEFHQLSSEKTRLLQVVEKLRLELQGRDTALCLAKAQYEGNISRLETQKEIKLYEYQAKIKRLEHELESNRDELRMLKERAAKELKNLLTKCKNFQEDTERLSVKHQEVRDTIINLQISEEEYDKLKRTPRDRMNLMEFASLKVFEHIMPLLLKTKELSAKQSMLQTALSSRDNELEVKTMNIVRLERELSQVRESYIQSNLQRESLRDELKSDDFRIRNFNRMKQERDKSEELKNTLEKEKTELEINFLMIKKDKEMLEEKVKDFKLKSRQLEMDLSQYKSDYLDAKNQLEKTRDELLKNTSQLNIERERCESTLDKYLKSRTEIIEYQNSEQNSQHILHITREKLLEIERQIISCNENNETLARKNNELSDELERLQLRYTRDITALREEENEIRSSYNSLSKNHQNILEEKTNILQECQDAKSALHKERLSITKELIILKKENESIKYSLSQYKALEIEYKATLTAFASAQDQMDNNSSKPQFPSLRIMEGSLSEETITLTRRVLHLERENSEACIKIHNLTTELEQIKSSISSYKTAIGMAGKPSSDLMKRITNQQDQILSLEKALNATKDVKEHYTRETEKLKSDLQKASSAIKVAEGHKQELVHLHEDLVEYNKIMMKRRTSKNREDGGSGISTINSELPLAMKILKESKIK